MSEQTFLTIIAVHLIGFWVFLYLYVRARRQVRCLHYCFIEASDWLYSQLKDGTGEVLQIHGEIPYTLLNFEDQWSVKKAYLLDLCKRARVRVPPNNHIHYPVETL